MIKVIIISRLLKRHRLIKSADEVREEEELKQGR